MNTNLRQWLLIGLAALSLALVGCVAGDKGGTGNTGATGATGAAGVSAASTSQATLTATITGASINSSGQPVVTFTVADQNGLTFTGLSASQMEFTVAKLIPAANGDASYWQDYIVSAKTAVSPATGNIAQGSFEGLFPGNYGTLTYANGVYTYTFKTNITALANPTTSYNNSTAYSASGNYYKAVDLSYQPSYTTRVALAIRGTNAATGATIPYANATFDFVPNGGAASGTRYVVATDTCNQCHNQLQLHGGPRNDAKYCPTCHNPGNMDVAGSTIDFKQLIHRLHNGSALPSVVGLPSSSISGAAFQILDYVGSPVNFSTSVFPQMNPSKALLVGGVIGTAPGGNDNSTKNPPASGYFPTCTKCHGETTDAAGNTVTNAANWSTVPTLEACTSCHDNVVFTAAALTGAQIRHGGYSAAGALTDNSTCAGCHSSSGAGLAKIDQMHGYAANIAAASSTFQYNIGAVTFDTNFNQLTAVVSVTNPVNGKYYDIQQDARFCRNNGSGTIFFNPTAGGVGNGTCYSTTGSLTMSLAIGAAEHTNGGNGSIITPASVISLNLLNPLNYSSAVQTGSTGAYSGGNAANGNPTPPALNGLVAGTACGNSTVTNCTFLATVPLPLNAVAAIKSAGSFTVALYGAPSVNYIANDSINVLAPSFGNTGKSLASGVTSNACGAGLNGVTQGSPTTIGTPAGMATNPCITVSVPVPAVTADFGGVPGGGCGGACTLTALTPGTDSTSGRRVVVNTDNGTGVSIANGGGGNTGGSCNTCHGTMFAHGGSRAGNVQLCVLCHNPNNTDLDDRPTGAVGASLALDGLREHSVDFKVMIHGIHAGTTTNSFTGVALSAAAAWSTGTYTQTTQTPTNTAQTDGQMRQTGLLIYGYRNNVMDFSSVFFPGRLDNCTNCHAAGTFTLPLASVVLPPTVTSNPAAANQWEALGHTMTLGSSGTCTAGGATEGVNGNNICMKGQHYSTTGTTSGGIPLVVTAYGAAGNAPPTGLEVCTVATPCYALNSVAAGTATTAGTFQLAASSGTTTAIAISGAGVGTFAIGPANMNNAALGNVWSPTAAVCSSCHDDGGAATHMLQIGNAYLSGLPGTPGNLVQPYASPGSPLTKAAYLTNVGNGYGNGVETCDICHGPGGVVDVSVVHKDLSLGP